MNNIPCAFVPSCPDCKVTCEFNWRVEEFTCPSCGQVVDADK